jgi:hypothetical protein
MTRFEAARLHARRPAAKRVNPGRKPSPERCPCGAMTRARAAKREQPEI